jgi:cholesterol 7-desaturase
MSWVPYWKSSDVLAGQIVSFERGDLELVIWRSEAGRLCAMDARCPHEWSHFGADGMIDGDEIVCTAHFWRFDRGGRGTKLNVKGRRDEKADVAVFAVREAGGAIELDLPD